MDAIKKEKEEAEMRFNRSRRIRRAINASFPIFVLALVCCVDVETWLFYRSFLSLVSENTSKEVVFLFCILILVPVLVDAGLIDLQGSSMLVEIRKGDPNHDQRHAYVYMDTSIDVVQTKEEEEKGEGSGQGKGEEKYESEEEFKDAEEEEAKGDTEEEEQEPREPRPQQEQEREEERGRDKVEGLLSDVELDKRFEEFILNFKRGMRMEAIR